MDRFETFEGVMYRAIFPLIVGSCMFAIGAYAAVKFEDWKRNAAMGAAIVGVFLMIGALLGFLDLMRRLHSW